MTKNTIAYLAGVVDSDGCIAIKRRRNSYGNWTFTGLIQVRQAEQPAVTLAHATFGGNLRLDPPAAVGRRPMHCWQITHRGATKAATTLLAHLRIKRQQAELIIRFGAMMKDSRLRRSSHWFTFSRDESFYTAQDAARIKGISHASVYQAVRNGSVPAKHLGRRVLVPRRFWDSYAVRPGSRNIPPEYLELREELWRQSKFLNRTGPR